MSKITATNTQSGDFRAITGTDLPGLKRGLDISSPPASLKWSTVGVYTYVGQATIGTLDSAASWLIFRVDTTNGTVLYASSIYDQVWNDRESLVYA